LDQRKGYLSRLQIDSNKIILAAYTYDIKYKPTKKHGNADALSRLPISSDEMFEKDHNLELEINMIQTNQLTQLPLLATDAAKAIKIRCSPRFTS